MDWLSSLFERTPKLPEEFQWHAKCRDKELLKRPLEEVRFVALDTETTGLNPRTDRILSIGAIGIVNFGLHADDSFEAVLHQDNQNNEAIAIHEITPGQSKLGANKTETLKSFLTYLDDAVIIGHHVEFDRQILSAAYQRNFGFSLLNRSYDTVNLVRRVDTHFSEPGLFKPEDLSLENLCQRYHLELHDRHTAMGDAFATGLLFVKLLKRLQKRKVRTLKDLLSR